MFTPSSTDVPVDLQSYVALHDVVALAVTTKEVRTFYANRTEYKAGVETYYELRGLASSTIVNTISDADIAASSSLPNPFDLLNYLSTKYNRSELARRLSAQNDLANLTYSNLRDYISTLDTTLHKFTAAGGTPGDWLVLQQLGKLPTSVTT